MDLARLSFLLVALAAPASAQVSTLPVEYRLHDDASVWSGCIGSCFCPGVLDLSLEGTFVLQYTSTDAGGFDHYDILNVDWLLTSSAPATHVTGSGHYMRNGFEEQVELDLVTNGQGPATHYVSSLVVTTAAFPTIDVAAGWEFIICTNQVYRILASPGTAAAPFCAGDGSGTGCPCGNVGAAGHGCGNSVDASGAFLWAHGSASLGNDTLVLESGGTANTALLFFQGTTQLSGGAGIVFGDGLRCVGGTIRRLRTAQAVGGEAFAPGAGDPPLSVTGSIGAPTTREYQVWYRNAAPYCTTSTFNLTNGLQIVWNP
jgi:hypothetical protein